MTNAYKQIDAGARLLKFGERFVWKGKAGVVGATTEKDGRTIAADFQHDGVVERIILEKGHRPLATSAETAEVRSKRTASSATSSGTSLEQLADGVVVACKQYVDVAIGRKFTDLTSALEELLESHQRKIRDDMEELQRAQTKCEALEARLSLLEGRRP